LASTAPAGCLRPPAPASSHSRAGRSPRRFDSLTASARSRAFSSSSDRNAWRGDSWSGKVAAASSSGDKTSENSSPRCRRGTTLSAARNSPARRSCLLCGGRPMPMAGPQFRTCPQSFPKASIESRANLSPKWDRPPGAVRMRHLSEAPRPSLPYRQAGRWIKVKNRKRPPWTEGRGVAARAGRSGDTRGA
jgi:hypothetical protein